MSTGDKPARQMLTDAMGNVPAGSSVLVVLYLLRRRLNESILSGDFASEGGDRVASDALFASHSARGEARRVRAVRCPDTRYCAHRRRGEADCDCKGGEKEREWRWG